LKANVETLRAQYEELGTKLSHPDALKDQTEYRRLTRDHSRVRKQLEIGEKWLDLKTQVDDNHELLKSEKDADMVEMESSFVFDLGAESMQSVQLVAAFEEEFSIEMDEDALSVQTVGDAIEYITKYLS
jgi:acyl carrier protein